MTDIKPTRSGTSGNWGYAIPPWHRQMAHALVDHAGVHIVHGHSSHHPRRLEMRNGCITLYGCGDLINDYEGIGGMKSSEAISSLDGLPSSKPTGLLELSAASLAQEDPILEPGKADLECFLVQMAIA